MAAGLATFCLCWAWINWPPMDLLEQVGTSPFQCPLPMLFAVADFENTTLDLLQQSES